MIIYKNHIIEFREAPEHQDFLWYWQVFRGNQLVADNSKQSGEESEDLAVARAKIAISSIADE